MSDEGPDLGTVCDVISSMMGFELLAVGRIEGMSTVRCSKVPLERIFGDEISGQVRANVLVRVVVLIGGSEPRLRLNPDLSSTLSRASSICHVSIWDPVSQEV